jgi:hypothetical protein
MATASITKTKTSELTEVIVLMVEHILKNWHQIYQELIRWREIIDLERNRDKRVYIT